VLTGKIMETHHHHIKKLNELNILEKQVLMKFLLMQKMNSTVSSSLKNKYNSPKMTKIME
jgi:hypothetical protein